MAPFYGWGSTASRLQPLRRGSLLFTIQFPEIPGIEIKINRNFYFNTSLCGTSKGFMKAFKGFGSDNTKYTVYLILRSPS